MIGGVGRSGITIETCSVCRAIGLTYPGCSSPRKLELMVHFIRKPSVQYELLRAPAASMLQLMILAKGNALLRSRTLKLSKN